MSEGLLGDKKGMCMGWDRELDNFNSKFGLIDYSILCSIENNH